ncbi:phosphoribosylformylglycinamidine synthase subunit PurL [bacterium]|jgi:phosphoribosylformylglycinamidine synthase subunit PurL|nr:phosphoribosylformylglycinamidine synthase subunit PurL [bacterium]
MNLSQEEIIEVKQILGTDPSIVELQIFDTMWSEHCSYKSSKRILKQLPVTGKNVALGIGEDSGIIRFTKKDGKSYCLAVSHESHNHPSQILPVEGAATGVGGVVRDVYCMGADVIGVLNSLHFGDQINGPSIVKDIKDRVILGVSDYANPLGVPVLGGETVYHPSYNENCLVNVAAIGLVEESEIIHSYAPKRAGIEPYDVILIGKSTDASGFGGASFSSQTLDKEDESSNLGAVQLHDPFMKRVVVEAMKQLFKEIRGNNIEVGYKDLGAGGIACAASEIAASGGFGVDIDLSKVLCGIEGLGPEVISCSETQERFCMVVPRGFSQRCCDIFNKDFDMGRFYPNAGASVVGHVTNNPFFRLFHKGEVVGNIPITAITTDVSVIRESKPKEMVVTELSASMSKEQIKENLEKSLSHPNNCSKKPVYRHFDQGVRGDTVMYPGEGDAVIVTPIEGCDVGVVTSIDSNLYGEHDPYISGAYAVAEGIRNVISAGGLPLAVTDCLNYGNPENPHVFHQFEEGIRGIKDACFNLNPESQEEPLPIIAGNVSFYNESKTGSEVVPSPVILVVGKIEEASKGMRAKVDSDGQTLILIGKRYSEFGGTQIGDSCPELGNVPPQVRYSDERLQNTWVSKEIESSLISSCHDISMGGLWLALVEMAMGRNGKAEVGMTLNFGSECDLGTTLFSENGGYVVSVSTDDTQRALDSLKDSGVDFEVLGHTTKETVMELAHYGELFYKENMEELASHWN